MFFLNCHVNEIQFLSIWSCSVCNQILYMMVYGSVLIQLKSKTTHVLDDLIEFVS